MRLRFEFNPTCLLALAHIHCARTQTRGSVCVVACHRRQVSGICGCLSEKPSVSRDLLDAVTSKVIFTHCTECSATPAESAFSDQALSSAEWWFQTASSGRGRSTTGYTHITTIITIMLPQSITGTRKIKHHTQQVAPATTLQASTAVTEKSKPGKQGRCTTL